MLQRLAHRFDKMKEMQAHYAHWARVCLISAASRTPKKEPARLCRLEIEKHLAG
jgi:hypothetical protein